MDIIDLHFQGRERAIATAVLRGPQGLTLIDPGPTSCLPALEDGLARLGGTLRDVRLILLTHIHLDHAGATGSIVARVPHVRVGVHERGAPHMVTPARLIASATRLYGDRMDTLWGAFEPVPADQVLVLTGGERLDVGGHPVRVAYTPGHAIHHVSYLDESDGTAYVGDTCGVRVVGDYTIAATPPPPLTVAIHEEPAPEDEPILVIIAEGNEPPIAEPETLVAPAAAGSTGRRNLLNLFQDASRRGGWR